MFCSQCGAQLSDTSKFCHKCGTSCSDIQISRGVYTDDELLQMATDFSDNYLKIPNLPSSLLSNDWNTWRFDFLNDLNPVTELEYLKEELRECLTKTTRGAVGRERIERIVDLAYPICRKIALANQKAYFLGVMKKFCSKHEFDEEEFTYSTIWHLEADISTVIICVRCLALICWELQDSSGLRVAKTYLSLLETFHCNADGDTGNIKRSGSLLTLSQFKPVRDYYYILKEYIHNLLMAIDPAAKEEIEMEMSENKKQQEHTEQAETTSAATRVLMSIAMPLLLYIEYVILLGWVDFWKMESLALWVSGGLLTLLAILINIRLRKPVAVIILNAVLLALFYPLTCLVSWLIELLKSIFFIVIAGSVLFLVGFTQSDRMSPN